MSTTLIQLSPTELQSMLNEAMTQAAIAAAQQTGERWGVSDLARHYRCTEATIRNRRKAGALPPMSGDGWLRADVLKWDRDRAR